MNMNNRVDMWLMANTKYLPADKIMYVKERLQNLDDNRWSMLQTVELKDPTTILIISIFLGSLGVDRFMLGDTGMGVLKLLTGGCCGVLTIIDWFSIQDKAREVNFTNISMII